MSSLESSGSNSAYANESVKDNSIMVTKKRPKILALPNGPYYLLNDVKSKAVENLQNSKGEPLSTVSEVALCRCGASKNNPFCDGMHAIIGFSTDNKVGESISNSSNSVEKKIIKDKRKDYLGRKITVHDNRKICSHAAECINNLSSVFKLNSRPWIDPDASEINKIVDTIGKCPSGALSYSIDGIEYRNQSDRNPKVIVSKHGPYVITGGVELIGNNVQFGDGASKENYTLCRCGASNNKPFCDGMHEVINFKDDNN